MKKKKHAFDHESLCWAKEATVLSSKHSGHCWHRGQLVRSRAGRDCGQHYIVLDQSDGFLLVADGRKRPVEAPKKKNPLHLQVTHQVAADLNGPAHAHPPTNEEIRAAISALLSCEGVKEGD
ncbi:MAG: KOW domain-containing RNA-binding protein [Bacillota bacterium]|nr:KOW domain-containing RNA-binding protein [Bacillota bacterium]